MSEQVCPKCGEPIAEGEYARIKSPIVVVGKPGSYELIEHIPEMAKPKRDRRRHCGEWFNIEVRR